MKILLFFTFLISLSFGIQHLVGNLNNSDYTPFALVGVAKGGSFDEAYCYVPPINAVRFDKSLADWQTFEYRYGPKIQPILGPLIFGNLAKIIGLENLYIIADFIFPPLIFLFFYYFVNLMIRDSLLAVFSSLLLLGQEPLRLFVQKFGTSLLKYGGIDYFLAYFSRLNRPLTYARFDNPQFSFLLLLLGLLVFWQSFRKSKKSLFFFSGIILGLQWYVYSYYAIFVTFTLLIFLIIFLFLKSYREIKSLLLALVAFLATSFYYWFNYAYFLGLPQAEEFLIRVGKESGRWFDESSLWVIFLIFLIIFLSRKIKKKKEQTFILLLLLAAASCLNFQLFTGFSVQHFHWWSTVVKPMMILGLSYLLSLIFIWLEKKKSITHAYLQYLKKLFLFLNFLLLVTLFLHNFFISFNTAAAYFKDDKMHEAFAWLNKNTPKDAVIMTPSLETNYWLIIYTHNYIFTPHSLHSLAPTYELVERMAIAFEVFAVPKTYSQNFLTYRQSEGVTPYTHETLDLSGYPYLFSLKHGLEGPKSQAAQEELLQSLKIFQTVNLTSPAIKKKYKADYLFFGPSEKRLANANFKQDANLKLVFDNGEVQIFKILK